MAHMTKKKLALRERNNKMREMSTMGMNLGTRTCGHPAKVYAVAAAHARSWKEEW